ncbi:Prefoldin subunit 1 [Rhizophlyctis rosea]|nr:Prefoldin subunit 1 [Rhizophlyctis rosea]
MALPADVAQKVLLELQNKVVETSRQLSTVRAQISTRERERKVSELTAKELESMGSGVAAYRAVGKMFLQEPLPVLTKELRDRVEAAERDTKNLERAAAKLERDLNDAQGSWKEVMHRTKAAE